MADNHGKSVNRLFEEALALDTVARGVFLDSLAQSSPSMHQEVMGLFDDLALVEQEGFFDTADAAVNQVTPPVQKPVDLIGRRIGPYQLISHLGRGGMGTVYLAQREHPARLQVALKLLDSACLAPSLLLRFENEQRLLAMLNHRHIARFFDFGQTDRGTPYFVMEYIPGSTITEYCDAHRLSLAERCKLFVLVCDAVSHAHQKGIIHRDIKPANVMVHEQDGSPIPKVIDFGIARAPGDQSLTHTGLVIGTPSHMSPEQALGSQDIDTRTDVYSLGIPFYELLVGVLPHDPEELKRLPLQEQMRTIYGIDAGLPSVRLLEVDAGEIALNRRLSKASLCSAVRGDLDGITLSWSPTGSAFPLRRLGDRCRWLCLYPNHRSR